MNKQEHERMQMQEAFKKSHQAGALEFGGLWLRANDAAVSSVAGWPFDTATIEVKSLMSVVILSTLRALNPKRVNETNEQTIESNRRG